MSCAQSKIQFATGVACQCSIRGPTAVDIFFSAPGYHVNLSRLARPLHFQNQFRLLAECVLVVYCCGHSQNTRRESRESEAISHFLPLPDVEGACQEPNGSLIFYDTVDMYVGRLTDNDNAPSRNNCIGCLPQHRARLLVILACVKGEGRCPSSVRVGLNDM